MPHSHQVAYLVDAFLRNLLVIYDYGVVEISTSDEAVIHKLFYLPHEDESACACHFGLEIGKVIEHSELVRNHRRIVLHHSLDTETVIRIYGYDRTCLFIAHAYLLLNYIEVFVGVLLFQSYPFELLHIDFRAAVEYRHLGSINVYETIVHAGSVERSQCMFYGADHGIILAKHCPLRVSTTFSASASTVG